MLNTNRFSAIYKAVPIRLAGAKNRMVQAFMAVAKHPAVTGNIFISQEFEFRFILKFCAFAFLGCLLFTSLILFYCSGSLTTSFEDARLVIQLTSLTVFPGVLYTNLIILFLAVMISIILTFCFSFGIRKPLFRFREDIKSIANGDLTRTIQFRNRDLTTSLAQNINRMTLNLNSKISEVETGLKQTIETAASNKNISDELVKELIKLQRGIRESFIL
jgi:methyl-accepting chemotaxis protein